MTWTLRRILLAIVILSSLAVTGTLYWVAATYQRFAVDNQDKITGSTLSHLVLRQVEGQHKRTVNPFADEWSRFSTLVQGVKENDAENARLAANRIMLTLDVAEGRVRLRNVVVLSKDMQVIATADKGTGESLSVLPKLIDRLRSRDTSDRRQITSYLWRNSGGRPLYSTVAPVGGSQVAGFVEFVTDPIPDLAGVSDEIQGHFRLLDVNGTALFESTDKSTQAPASGGAQLNTLTVPIVDALGETWAVATLTRDISSFQAATSKLRNQALAIVATAILGSVLIGWLMLRLAVFSRMKDFAAITEMLAKGRTDVEIPSVGPDEFAIMRTSLELLKHAVEDREKATLALRQSEQRLRAIIDNTPNAIYLKDTNGRYTLVNTALATRQGFNPKDMIGLTAYDHASKEFADVVTALEKKVLETGKVCEKEVNIATTLGQRVGLTVKFPVQDADGIVTGIGTITIDITDRKQSEQALLDAREIAEEQAKLQRIILDNVGQGILVFRADSRPALWNDLATRFTGLSDAFLAESPTIEQCDEFQFRDFNFDTQTKGMVNDFGHRRKAGERDFVVTYQRRGIDGKTWVQISLRSLSDGMVVQTYQDITDLRRAIDAAQETQRLAEEANRAKSEFLSNMSHELRTPLNAIIGFTDFVIDNDDEPISEEQKASLSQVLKAGRHLLALINDVLDLSKIEAGAVSLSIEAVDAGLIFDECVSLTASFAAGRNVEVHNRLHGVALPAIEADRVRFKQVFLNLLTNAIKYNKDAGSVSIEQAPAEPGRLRIGVRDEGPGIAQDNLAKLFDPFDRLGAENSAIEGTGIGLTIAKNLVEQMGGKISVDSVIGEGSTFWLEMPISERPAEHHIDKSEVEGEMASDVEGLILYIEDNPANLELVRKIMSVQPGIDFIDAPTGELGIERARGELPDVILLDINLPGLDGFQVLETLCVTPETRHIPVIALTAAATEADVRRGQAAGFFSYLTKPIAARELMATIRRALRPTGSDAEAPSLRPNGKVLVVDDVAINLTITQKQLAKLGIACDAVEDPVRALEMLKSGDYALALVDIGMPVLNGIELTRRLRAAERQSGTHTPVIALTASYGSEEDIGRYRMAGMDGQLTKPVILKELASTLHRWFSLRKEGAAKQASAPGRADAPTDVDGPPIDLEQFKEILGSDDEGMIREMFDLFVELMPGELENLANAVAARDTTQSRDAAHRFKSAARNAAAGRLSELLQKIEKEAPEGVWETLDLDLQRVREECSRLREYLQATLEAPPRSS